jgi:hypothetical protein
MQAVHVPAHTLEGELRSGGYECLGSGAAGNVWCVLGLTTTLRLTTTLLMECAGRMFRARREWNVGSAEAVIGGWEAWHCVAALHPLQCKLDGQFRKVAYWCSLVRDKREGDEKSVLGHRVQSVPGWTCNDMHTPVPGRPFSQPAALPLTGGCRAGRHGILNLEERPST